MARRSDRRWGGLGTGSLVGVWPGFGSFQLHVKVRLLLLLLLLLLLRLLLPLLYITLHPTPNIVGVTSTLLTDTLASTTAAPAAAVTLVAPVPHFRLGRPYRPGGGQPCRAATAVVARMVATAAAATAQATRLMDAGWCGVARVARAMMAAGALVPLPRWPSVRVATTLHLEDTYHIRMGWFAQFVAVALGMGPGGHPPAGAAVQARGDVVGEWARTSSGMCLSMACHSTLGPGRECADAM